MLDYGEKETELYRMAEAGNVARMQALLEAGADPATALHKAARNGHADCVQALLRAGAQINAQNHLGVTALIEAVEQNHLECVQTLLGSSADPNIKTHDCYDDDGTALHIAAIKGHTACVKALIQAGADVHVVVEGDKTALIWAARNGHVECVEALLAGGARVPKDLKDADESCKVLLNEAKKKQSWLLGIGLMIWGLLTSVVLSVPVVVANAKALTLSAVWSSVSTIMSQGVASLPMLAQTLGLGALIITGLIMVSGMVNVYQLKAHRFDGVIKTIAASLMGVVGVSCVFLVGMQWINFNWMAHMTLTTLPMPVWVGLSITCVLVGLFAYSLRKCFIKSEGPTESEGSACDKTGDAQARQSIELEGSNRAKPVVLPVGASGASGSRGLARPQLN